jgi:hypothetical protein
MSKGGPEAQAHPAPSSEAGAARRRTKDSQRPELVLAASDWRCTDLQWAAVLSAVQSGAAPRLPAHAHAHACRPTTSPVATRMTAVTHSSSGSIKQTPSATRTIAAHRALGGCAKEGCGKGRQPASESSKVATGSIGTERCHRKAVANRHSCAHWIPPRGGGTVASRRLATASSSSWVDASGLAHFE